MFGSIGAVLLALLVTLVSHFWVSSMIDSQEQRNNLLRGEITQLDKKIEEIVALEEQKARMIARMEVIEKLQRSRPQVVQLFDQVVRTLPDGVYLTSVKQTDRKLEIIGVAQSSTRVSAFMRNIDASDTLSAPELKVIQTRKDNSPGAEFTLFAQLRAAEQPDEEGLKPAGGKPRVREASR
ncbi:MAG: PilN domain-containing protein [Steroidobacteraceae bacterium]|nr:PilN domain-containing protein [Steroidobacteraceae bacterium]